MTSRNIGIELFRVFCMLAICMQHAVVFSGTGAMGFESRHRDTSIGRRVKTNEQNLLLQFTLFKGYDPLKSTQAKGRLRNGIIIRAYLGGVG